MFKIRTPQTQQELDAYFDLRWRILRKPWDQPEGSEKDELEDQCYHVMSYSENNTLAGVGRLQFNSDKEAQIRYMAVEPEYERKGVGKLMVNTFENKASEMDIKIITLDAREPALGFYEKLGYVVKEKSYLLFSSIQHYKMRKNLF